MFMTTVEVDDRTLKRLKDAREIIQKRFNIKMRMPDLMDHLVPPPEKIVEMVHQSIKDVRIKP